MVDISAWIPTGMTQLSFLLLVLASLATSFMTAAFGIGGGVVLIVVGSKELQYFGNAVVACKPFTGKRHAE